MRRSSCIYKQLLQHNVQFVFGYPGAAMMALLDEFHPKNNNDIKFIVNSCEQNCGYAATVYAKVSGKTGIVMVTSGPGITNCITALLDAKNDSTPVIVLSVNVPLKKFGTDSFQEADAVKLTKGATKWSYFVQQEDDVIAVIDHAFFLANHGKKGSVHIDIPKCLLTGKNERGVGENLFSTAVESMSLSKPVEKLAKIVLESKRPILHVGKGATEVFKDVRKLSKDFHIPTVTTLHGVGIVDERDELSLQMGGTHGNTAANNAIQNADCIVSIGARFDDRSTGEISKYAPMCENFVHFNIEESEINKVITTDNFLIGDVKKTLPLFINAMNTMVVDELPKDSLWLERVKNWKDNNHRFCDQTSEDDDLTVARVLIELNKALQNANKRTLVTTGVGNHQIMTCNYLTWCHPKQFLTSGSLGVMGTGLPYAIGAQLAYPDHTVVDIDGDGSLLMTVNDLKTVKEYGLPVKIFVMNNSSLDMVRAYQKEFFNDRLIGVEYKTLTNFALIAEGFGMKGITCKNRSHLKECIDFCLDYDGAILVDCIVRKCTIPQVPPGAGLSEMINCQ